MEETSSKPFWTAARRRFWLVGGLLIVLVGAGIAITYLVNSRPDHLPRGASKGELAAYLSDEHAAAFREGTRLDQKFPVTDPAGIPNGMHDWVGNSKTIEEVFPGGGVKLLGAGKSAVPGAGLSAHFRLAGEPGGAQLSLFVKQYRQLPRLDEISMTLKGRGVHIEVWRKAGLVYHLVGATPEDVAILRKAMGAPAPTRPY